jgi:hypothetical protein
VLPELRKDKENWKKTAMTPTFFGLCALGISLLIGLRKSAWRKWLRVVLFLFGVTIGYGGLGIALRNHVAESGRDWGWASLVSHWPSFDTWESLFWHGIPAAIATVIAFGWFREAQRCKHSEP